MNTQRRTFPSFLSKWWQDQPEEYGRNVTLFLETRQGHKGTRIGGRELVLVGKKKKREVVERNYCQVYCSGSTYQRRLGVGDGHGGMRHTHRHRCGRDGACTS